MSGWWKVLYLALGDGNTGYARVKMHLRFVHFSGAKLYLNKILFLLNTHSFCPQGTNSPVKT